METHEFTASTVEEATAAASEKLGVPAEQLEIKVLDQSKGLFGKGTVRVQATLKQPVEEPAAEKAPEKPSRKPRATKAKPKEEAPKEPQAEAVVEIAAPPVSSGFVEEIVATQEDADAIIPKIEEVLAASGLDVNVRLKNLQSRYVNIEIDGEEAGYLIGRNGEVLNALQYLMNISISQSLNNGVRVTLDADDYRSQRETSLMRYAERIAQEVRNRREEAVLDPLPAFERRIIHKALSEIDGVTTYSEGEEPNRRVVIAPAEETAGKA